MTLDPSLAQNLAALGEAAGAAALIVGASALGYVVKCGAKILRRLGRVEADAQEKKEAVEAIKAQVVNSHGTVLRDDLDAVQATATDALKMVEQVSDQVGGLTRQLEHLAQTIDGVGDRVSDVVQRIDGIGRDVIEVRHEIHDDRRRINSLFGMVTAPKSTLAKTNKKKEKEG